MRRKRSVFEYAGSRDLQLQDIPMRWVRMRVERVSQALSSYPCPAPSKDYT